MSTKKLTDNLTAKRDADGHVPPGASEQEQLSSGILELVSARPTSSSLFDTVKVGLAIKHRPLHVKHRLPDGLIRGKHPWSYKAPGTHDSCPLLVKSSADGSTLFIEGSFVKFLTGQNVFGFEDLHRLCLLVTSRVTKLLAIKPTEQEIVRLQRGQYKLLRVDFAVHCDCGNIGLAEAMASAIRRRVQCEEKNYSVYDYGSTQYIDQSSKRRSLKIYLKLPELRAHPVPASCKIKEQVEAIAGGLLRVEMTLRAGELKRLGLDEPIAWSSEKARTLIASWLKRVRPARESRALTTKGVGKLSMLQQALVSLHARAGTLDDIQFARRGLKQQRKVILQRIDYDIAMPRQHSQRSGVRKLQQVFDRGVRFASLSKEGLLELEG